MKRVTTNRLLVITIIVNMSYFVSACGSRQKAHFNRGLAYYNRGQLEQSTAEYQKAIQINPNFAQARNNLGNVYYNCLLYTSPSPRDGLLSRMPSSA